MRFFLPRRNSPSGPRPPHYRGFMIALRHTTVFSIPLNEWSARRRDIYLTTHNTQKRQISIPQRDSNSQSQQASGRKPTPSTVRPSESAVTLLASLELGKVAHPPANPNFSSRVIYDIRSAQLFMPKGTIKSLQHGDLCLCFTLQTAARDDHLWSKGHLVHIHLFSAVSP
jgi:hypothetical protein